MGAHFRFLDENAKVNMTQKPETIRGKSDMLNDKLIKNF